MGSAAFDAPSSDNWFARSSFKNPAGYDRINDAMRAGRIPTFGPRDYAPGRYVTRPAQPPALQPGTRPSVPPAPTTPPQRGKLAQASTVQTSRARNQPSGGGALVPSEVVLAAQAAQRKWNVPASITIAQWMLESGHGKHMPPGSNNPFGIKAAKGQPFVNSRTKEQTKDGRTISVVAPFRKFDSMAEAFELHGKLLATSRHYESARQHIDDPDLYANALTGHYATDQKYGSKLISQMRKYNLYQYDD